VKIWFGSCLVASFLAVLPVSVHGQQLLWEGEDLQFNPSPADKTVVGHFKFKNIGQVAARITSVTSSCSCTTVDFPKKSVVPNESGEITATFTIGARTGNQEKTIMVESNDRKRPVTVLLMKVAIPEIAQMRPSFLFWSQGEPLDPKEISFKIMNGFPVKAIAVESSNPKITAKVEPVKPGQEYRIIVTPSETDQQIMAMLSIKTDYPPGNPKIFYANVRVQPKK
jgi:hypothetical protein